MIGRPGSRGKRRAVPGQARGTGRDRRQALLLGLIVGVCLWGFCLWLGASSFGPALENLVLDAAWRLRAGGQRPPELLVVAIDEPSFQEIGLAWPWPRRLHARLLDTLHRAGARLVVLDMVFAEATTPGDDRALAEALDRDGPVVLASALETVNDPGFFRRVLVRPLPLLAGRAAGVGLAVLTPDADGAVRRFATRYDGLPILGGVAVAVLEGREAVPAARGLIRFPGPSRTVDTVSYAAVLDPDHPLPAARIRGKVVVVGRALAASATPLGQADRFVTPFTRTTGLTMPGPELHALVIDTLLRGGPGRELSLAAVLRWAGWLLPLAGAWLFCLRPVAAALGGAVLAGGVLAGALGLFAWRFCWVPPAVLATGCLAGGGLAAVYRGLVESRKRRFLTRAFSRYLAPAVVRDLLSRPETLELGGAEAEVTVFFSDLAGFTTLSEGLSPRELIGLLNAYFTPATAIILASGGTLDKFIGDAIMAFWGAPLPLADHAARALGAALDMRRDLAAFARESAARGLPRFEARMGLHTGAVVVGNVGSRDRFDYTVLGDTVNLASRLESLNKYYGTGLLVSRAVREAAGEGFLFREVDTVRVKGRAEAVAVFEPLGRAGEVSPVPAALFEAALARYRRRDFAGALTGFSAARAACPGDGPSGVLAARCRAFLAAPPPEDWDGSFAPGAK